MERNGQNYNFHQDGLGSIIAITDASGNKVQSYDYDSFGNPTATTIFRNSYQLTGREWDWEIGLLFLRNRYYDPVLGKFISKDPISFAGGDTNLYRYVGNNPVNWIDPSGLWRSPAGIYDEAAKDAKSKFPRKDLHDGHGDAYRHCLASCMMARENGSTVASLLGWAHEKRGDLTRNQDRGEREMDDYNNAIGRQCSKDSKNTQDCQQKCMSAVTNGDLKTYQTGSTPGYWY